MMGNFFKIQKLQVNSFNTAFSRFDATRIVIKISDWFILSIILCRYANVFLYEVINFVSFLSPSLVFQKSRRVGISGILPVCC
jgi:hypothetical protein